MNIVWSEIAWAQYIEWQGLDKKTLRKINQLINDAIRNGQSKGIGKPEPLKDNLAGYWSRRIDDKNRLVYRTRGANIEIISCAEHYGSK